MRVYCEKDYEGMSRRAASILSAQVILKPNSVLGLATGSTPVGMYRQLIDWHRKGDLDFSETVTFNLDEYCGLGPDDSQSYHRFMEENFFSHINIRSGRTHLPDGLARDSAEECKRYERSIRDFGGIDMQLLGIGLNGHIGFNEPGAAFEKDTFLVDLTESTIHANMRFFDPGVPVPRKAYTMGIRSIMRARRVLLIVSGEQKAEIMRKAFGGPVTPEVPASILQFHNDVTLVGDESALHSLLESSCNEN